MPPMRGGWQGQGSWRGALESGAPKAQKKSNDKAKGLKMAKLQVSETVSVYKLNTLLRACKTRNASMYVQVKLSKCCEIDELLEIEIKRINRKTYQIVHIMTEDNAYDMEDEQIKVDATCFDTSIFGSIVNVMANNDLFGEHEIKVLDCEKHYFE